MENKNYLSLKFGTIKSWDFSHSKLGVELLTEYNKLGASLSVMAQKDTPRQKEIICKLIDLCEDGTVLLDDMDGECVSNKKAKEYVMNHSFY